MRLDELPLDILLHLAAHWMGWLDVKYGLAPTCRLLYAVANDPYVWSRLVVRPTSAAQLVRLASQHSNIAIIDADCMESSTLTSTELDALPNLTALLTPVGNPYPPLHEDAVLPSTLRAFTGHQNPPSLSPAVGSLESLTLGSLKGIQLLVGASALTQLTVYNAWPLGRDSDAAPHLRSLTIHVTGFERQWPAVVANHTALTSLSIVSEYAELPSDLGFCNLKHVLLSGSVIPSEILRTLAATSPHLTSLCLPNLKPYLAHVSAMEEFSSLRTLQLTDAPHNVTREHLQTQKWNSTLTSLHGHRGENLDLYPNLRVVGWGVVTDNTFRELHSVGRLGQLTSLQLHMSLPLSEEAFRVVGSNCTRLRTLSVASWRAQGLTSDRLNLLAPIGSSGCLRTLVLRGLKVSAEALCYTAARSGSCGTFTLVGTYDNQPTPQVHANLRALLLGLAHSGTRSRLECLTVDPVDWKIAVSLLAAAGYTGGSGYGGCRETEIESESESEIESEIEKESESWEQSSGAVPGVDTRDAVAAERALLLDPRYLEASKESGIGDSGGGVGSGGSANCDGEVIAGPASGCTEEAENTDRSVDSRTYTAAEALAHFHFRTDELRADFAPFGFDGLETKVVSAALLRRYVCTTGLAVFTCL